MDVCNIIVITLNLFLLMWRNVHPQAPTLALSLAKMTLQWKHMWSSKMHQRLRGVNMCLFTCYNHLWNVSQWLCAVMNILNRISVPLTMWSCWPALWGRLGFWSACPRLWQSGQTLAYRCAPSPSSPAWAGATPRDSPSGREDGSPHLLLWSPASKQTQWSVVERRLSYVWNQHLRYDDIGGMWLTSWLDISQ